MFNTLKNGSLSYTEKLIRIGHTVENFVTSNFIDNQPTSEEITTGREIHYAPHIFFYHSKLSIVDVANRVFKLLNKQQDKSREKAIANGIMDQLRHRIQNVFGRNSENAQWEVTTERALRYLVPWQSGNDHFNAFVMDLHSHHYDSKLLNEAIFEMQKSTGTSALMKMNDALRLSAISVFNTLWQTHGTYPYIVKEIINEKVFYKMYVRVTSIIRNQ